MSIDEVGDRRLAGGCGRHRRSPCSRSGTTGAAHLNLDKVPSVETAIDLVAHKQKREINTVLSNSFRIGGTNASLILRGLS